MPYLPPCTKAPIDILKVISEHVMSVSILYLRISFAGDRRDRRFLWRLLWRILKPNIRDSPEEQF